MKQNVPNRITLLIRVTEVKSPHKVQKKDNLDEILENLRAKKISSIQKSKIDWDKYKKETGIEGELEFHKKDG